MPPRKQPASMPKFHIPLPRQPREAHVRLQEKQAPPQQHHPMPPRKQPASMPPPLQPPNVEDPKQVPPGPQSSPVGQTYQGQTERLPEPPQEPHLAPGQSKDPPGILHSQTSRESHLPGKLKGSQHEERCSWAPRGPQRHTGNRFMSDPDKISAERAHETKPWKESGT
nr:F-box only protein 11-like [Procambarus clarkii]